MADLLIDKHGRTTVLTINRPESRNALGGTAVEDMTAAIREFNADPEQYVLVITGAGDKAFCSGADLTAMAGDGEAAARLPMPEGGPDIFDIGACEKPVIAAVNGACVAAGFEMALCCDIRLASENAWFGLFEVKWGIVAGIAVNVLPRLLPMGTAMDLLLSADRLGAEEAFRLGLVQKLTPPEQLMEAALQKAEMIAANSQPAVWGTKKVLKFWRDAMMAEQYRYYEAVVHRVFLSGDFHEGPKAFAEKRAPQFKNRWPEP